MNIKLLNQFINLCKTIGVEATPEGFYNYVGQVAPSEQPRVNLDVLRGMM